MKQALCIVGAGLIIGGAAVAIYLLNNKKKHDACLEHKEQEKMQAVVADAPLKEVASIQEEPVYEDVKSSVIESMYSRHEGAAAILRDSVDTIRENLKVPETTNNEIDEVSDELDKMLSED